MVDIVAIFQENVTRLLRNNIGSLKDQISKFNSSLKY